MPRNPVLNTCGYRRISDSPFPSYLTSIPSTLHARLWCWGKLATPPVELMPCTGLLTKVGSGGESQPVAWASLWLCQPPQLFISQSSVTGSWETSNSNPQASELKLCVRSWGSQNKEQVAPAYGLRQRNRLSYNAPKNQQCIPLTQSLQKCWCVPSGKDRQKPISCPDSCANFPSLYRLLP